MITRGFTAKFNGEDVSVKLHWDVEEGMYVLRISSTRAEMSTRCDSLEALRCRLTRIGITAPELFFDDSLPSPLITDSLTHEHRKVDRSRD